MRSLIILLALLLPAIAFGQIRLKPGYYKSQDGYITITIEHEGDVIKMQEPTRTNEYRLAGANTYRHVEDKYANYGIVVTDEEHFDAIKDGKANHTWSYSGRPVSTDDLNEGSDECPVYEKYQQLAENDKSDTQVYTFCGAAALFRCNMNDEGFNEYAKQIISSLKLILVNPGTNPCSDVFSNALWNAN